MKRYLSTGFFLLVIILAFFTWATFFEIDQQVKAQGQIIPHGHTQIIQSAESGVLKSLNVKEGDQVSEGQILAVLEKERANAGVEEIEVRIDNLNILKERASAEAKGMAPDFSGYRKSNPEMVAAQMNLYNQNNDTLRQELAAFNDSLRLADEEYQLTKRLQMSGDVSRVELMRVERQIIEIKQRQRSVRDKFKLDAQKEISKIEEEIASLRTKLQERKSILSKTDIVSPVNGVVKVMRITTLGGVLHSGDELMQISPTEGDYVIEAKVNPADIGQLAIGLPVNIRLDAFDYTIFGALAGHIDYISSDTLVEQGSNGQTIYYRANVKIDANTNPKIRLNELKPGMTAALDIRTGRRSLAVFILKPLIKSFSGALTQR